MEDREPYITGGKMREIKFSFMWQHQETGRWLDKRYTLDEVIGGDPYDDMSDSPLLRNYHHTHTREFTGLEDKNGKEIYEGDVLSGCYGIPPKQVRSVVEFQDGSFINKTPKDNPKQITTFEFMICLDPEVIGNIYEDENKVDKGDK